ncbi:hypothetical protein D9M72_639240 [compost metagenome]
MISAAKAYSSAAPAAKAIPKRYPPPLSPCWPWALTMANMPAKATANQNSFCTVIFSPRNSAANTTSMNGCTLYTAVPMAIEARE